MNIKIITFVLLQPLFVFITLLMNSYIMDAFNLYCDLFVLLRRWLDVILIFLEAFNLHTL